MKVVFFMKSAFLLTLFNLIFFLTPALSQDEDAFYIKKIYDHTLTEGICDTWLQHLSDSIGGRLSGSANSFLAIDYTLDVLKSIPLVDRMNKQPCMVPRWERGDPEHVSINWTDDGKERVMTLDALALGSSIGTGESGVTGDIVEVFGLDTLESLGRKKLADKIVFFNRPMNPKKINTGQAYGEAVDQRVHGANRAAKYGAKAVLVRSMTLAQNDVPHTGVQSYVDGTEPIPSLAISTNSANALSNILDYGNVSAYIKNNSRSLDSIISYNVIAEIKGSVYPDKIILVGGHLDSWDVGGGAHDDGAGCVHAMQVIKTLSDLNYKPRHTIRCVLFTNEENGLAGGNEYARASNENGEYHLAAIESDSGGFTPRGFACAGHPQVFKSMLTGLKKFDEFLSPYDLYLKPGGSGADINPLKSQKGLLIGFKPDSQRYFDYHHTAEDVYSNVNPRELKLGAAAITSLVYLIDQKGL